MKITLLFSSACSPAVAQAGGFSAAFVTTPLGLFGATFVNSTFPFELQTPLQPVGSRHSKLLFVPKLAVTTELIMSRELDIYALDSSIVFSFNAAVFACQRYDVPPVALLLEGVQLPLSLGPRKVIVAVVLGTLPFVALSSGSLAMLQMRHVLQLELSVCERSFALPVTRAWSLLQLRWGSLEGQYMRGGLVSIVAVKACILAGALLVLVLIHCGVRKKHIASVMETATSLRMAGGVFNLCFFPAVLPGVYFASSLMTRVGVSIDLSSVAADTSWPIAFVVVILGLPLVFLVWLTTIGFAFHVRPHSMKRTVAERLATLDIWLMGTHFWKANYAQYDVRLRLWYPVFAAFNSNRVWFIMIETAFCAGYGISGALLWRDCSSGRLLHGALALVHLSLWMVLQPHDAYAHSTGTFFCLAASIICSFLLVVASFSKEKPGGPLATLSDILSALEIAVTSFCGIVTLGKALRSSAAVTHVESVVWNGFARFQRSELADGKFRKPSKLTAPSADDLIWQKYVAHDAARMLQLEAAVPIVDDDAAEVFAEVQRSHDNGLSLFSKTPDEAVEALCYNFVVEPEAVRLSGAERAPPVLENDAEQEEMIAMENEEPTEDYFMRVCAAGLGNPQAASSWVFMGSSSDSDFTDAAAPRQQKPKKSWNCFLPSFNDHQAKAVERECFPDLTKEIETRTHLEDSRLLTATGDSQQQPVESLLMGIAIAAPREDNACDGLGGHDRRKRILRLLSRSRAMHRPSVDSSSSSSSRSTSSSSSSSLSSSSSSSTRSSVSRSVKEKGRRFRPRPPAHRTCDEQPACPSEVAVAQLIADGNYKAAQDLLD